jgi:hypothetical protein
VCQSVSLFLRAPRNAVLCHLLLNLDKTRTFSLSTRHIISSDASRVHGDFSVHRFDDRLTDSSTSSCTSTRVWTIQLRTSRFNAVQLSMTTATRGEPMTSARVLPAAFCLQIKAPYSLHTPERCSRESSVFSRGIICNSSPSLDFETTAKIVHLRVVQPRIEKRKCCRG